MMTASAILAEELAGEMPLAHFNNAAKPADAQPNDDQLWNAVVTRDSERDGEFVFAVASTGVYCRPSCPSRRPRRENVTVLSASGAGGESRLSRLPALPAASRLAAIRNRTRRRRSAATSNNISMSRSRSSAWAKSFGKARSICSGASKPRWESRRASMPIPAACASSSATCKPETT